MSRTFVVFLGVGGCLLGWKPDHVEGETGVDADTSGDADTDVDSDSDTDTVPGCETCPPYDARTITIGSSLSPTISSDQGFSDLYMYRDTELIWHVWTNDLQNSITSVDYGVLTSGTSDAGPAEPLVDGLLYEVQIDAPCLDGECGEVVSSVYQPFTAGE